MQQMGPTHQLPLHRRKAGKTDYRKRYRLLLSGEYRLVIRQTNSRSIVQRVAYRATGDETQECVDSFLLRQYGWSNYTGNIPAAYLTGYLFGHLVQQAEEAATMVPDIGVFKPQKGSRIFAALKGIVDSGVAITANSSVFPSDARIRGEHIAECAEAAEGLQFQQRKEQAQRITEDFDQVKQKIEQIRGK